MIERAVEAGSRVWGTASEASDCDVRFVFCRPPEAYYRPVPLPDALECRCDGLPRFAAVARSFWARPQCGPFRLAWLGCTQGPGAGPRRQRGPGRVAAIAHCVQVSNRPAKRHWGTLTDPPPCFAKGPSWPVGSVAP
jgi:hypothetical protein